MPLRTERHFKALFFGLEAELAAQDQTVDQRAEGGGTAEEAD
jgi:hypothetical protein